MELSADRVVVAAVEVYFVELEAVHFAVEEQLVQLDYFAVEVELLHDSVQAAVNWFVGEQEAALLAPVNHLVFELCMAVDLLAFVEALLDCFAEEE